MAYALLQRLRRNGLLDTVNQNPAGPNRIRGAIKD